MRHQLAIYGPAAVLVIAAFVVAFQFIKPAPPDRVVMATGDHAHRRGVIHRDVKPANVFVAHRGGLCDVVKLLDFGLVQQTRIDAAVEANGGKEIAGTPLFMCPEQAVGGELSRRSDIYSLGVLLYELLTGSTPLTRERLKTIAVDEFSRAT